MTPDVAATWQAWSAVIQAGGSIAAIIAAILIANNQHRQNVRLVKHERRRVEEVDDRRNQAIFRVASGAVVKVEETWKKVFLTYTKRLIALQTDNYQDTHAINNELLGDLEILRDAVHRAVWEFEELTDAYRAWGALHALYHFETVDFLQKLLSKIKEVEIRIAHEDTVRFGGYVMPNDGNADDIFSDIGVLIKSLIDGLGRLPRDGGH
ncbi:hypothetical protein [Xanthomonas campestris]|uniref:hypothetical protein n=1 Tax=Xanthomonas campestris TaxID=339 RepID=UPI001E43D9C2|nr:hypothetical protein [Xanthomonas campestris]MCC8691062.1 hypothetical protein [Xanthomonas campestris]